MNEYWQDWARKAPGAPNDPYSIPSNAQGISLTHDFWVLPHAGTYDERGVRKSAMAASRQVLAMAKPEWVCGTEALGWPSHHMDTKMFPEFEQMISDYWERLLFPLKAFPMTGVISWGCFPDVSYETVNGRIMSTFTDSRLKGIMDYGMRRAPFLLYARSGERQYYEYGYRFSRFAADYGVAHWNAPGKERGVPITGDRGGLPFFWQGNTVPYSTIDGEIRHLLNDYYFTGNEHSMDVVKMIKKYTHGRATPRGIISISRILLTLAVMDWDEDICRMSRDFIHSTIDLQSQNGVKGDGYGAEYKDERNTCDLMEYYLETGDEYVKEAFLKLLDQKYRFERRGGPLGHRDYDGITYAIAYRMTGQKRYRAVVEQVLRDALYHNNRYPLSEQLADMPQNPLDWKTLPNRIWTGYQNPFIGFPAALKLIVEEGWTGSTTPLIVKPLKVPFTEVLFSHKKGEETQLSIYIRTNEGMEPEIPEVYSYRLDKVSQVDGIKAVLEKRMPRGSWWDKHADKYPRDPFEYYHSFVTIPRETPDGLYLLSPGRDITFSVLDSTAEKVALHCPEGFWSASVADHGGSIYGRSGEGMPMFFRVPAGLKKLEILLAGQACVKRSDGSVAVEMSDENTGKLEIPVQGKPGIWSIEPYIANFHGSCPPAFFKLFNVEPVISFGSPKLLPAAEPGRFSGASESLFSPESCMEFIPGIEGQALRMTSDLSLKFSRGAKLSEGGYSFFPGQIGTAEFWFRADRSTQEIPLPLFGNREFTFIEGPYTCFLQKYFRRGSRNVSSILQQALIPEQTGSPRVGFQDDFYLKGGEWTHIAFTWNIKEGKKGTEGNFAIFVNGCRLSEKGVSYGLKQLTGQQKFKLSDEGTYVVLGPFEGSMDILRLSDTVRYAGDFVPSKTAPEVDKNTRALFLFDGDMKGVSAFSKEPVEVR